MKTLSINVFGQSDDDKIIFVDEFSRAVSLILKKLNMPYKNMVYISDINGKCLCDLSKIIDIYTKDKNNCDCIIACLQATEALFMDQAISKKDMSEDNVRCVVETYLSDYYKHLSDLGFININKSLFSNTTPDYNTLYFIYNNFAGISIINELTKESGSIDDVVNPNKIKDIDYGVNRSNEPLPFEDEKEDPLPLVTNNLKGWKEEAPESATDNITKPVTTNNDFVKNVEDFINEDLYKGDND